MKNKKNPQIYIRRGGGGEEKRGGGPNPRTVDPKWPIERTILLLLYSDVDVERKKKISCYRFIGHEYQLVVMVHRTIAIFAAYP